MQNRLRGGRGTLAARSPPDKSVNCQGSRERPGMIRGVCELGLKGFGWDSAAGVVGSQKAHSQALHVADSEFGRFARPPAQ